MKKNINLLFVFLFLIAFSGLFFMSCEWKNEEEEFGIVVCDTSQVTLSGTVKPILQTNCYTCHSTQRASVAGAGINLEEYQALKGRAEDGSLFGSVNHSSGFSSMPKSGAKLSDCNISIIKAWIEKGAAND